MVESMFTTGCEKIPGQMRPEERKLVYSLVLKHQPKIVIETGTWHGGGSTFFIASALHENNIGRLFTIEKDAYIYDQVINNYQKHLPHLYQKVDFSLGASSDILPKILSQVNSVDFIMLDGWDDPDNTVLEYQLILPFTHIGTILVAHDWFGLKMSKLSPILSQNPMWKITQTIDKPESPVGIIALQRI